MLRKYFAMQEGNIHRRSGEILFTYHLSFPRRQLKARAEHRWRSLPCCAQCARYESQCPRDEDLLAFAAAHHHHDAAYGAEEPGGNDASNASRDRCIAPPPVYADLLQRGPAEFAVGSSSCKAISASTSASSPILGALSKPSDSWSVPPTRNSYPLSMARTGKARESTGSVSVRRFAGTRVGGDPASELQRTGVRKQSQAGPR